MTPESLFFIDLAGRSALVLAIAWVVVRWQSSLSAAGRYWIWLLAMGILPLLVLTIKLPATPLITFVETAGSSGVPVVEPAPSPAARHVVAGELLDSGHPVAAPAEQKMALGVESTERDSEPVARGRPEEGSTLAPLVWIYLAGVAVMILPLGLGWLRLAKLRAGAQPATGIVSPGSSGTEVLISSQISVPLTWGTLKPVILLPPSARSWSSERLELVVAHEEAHVNRRDFASGLFASLVRVMFWFQPLAWFAHRRLAVERELACDDLVLHSRQSQAVEYAEHLSAVVRGASGRAPVVAIAMARPSELVGRVRAILDSARNRATLSARAKRRMGLLALVLFVPLAFVRCAGEKSSDTTHHTTGVGIELREIDPAAITITVDGQRVDVPGGAKFSMATREVSQAEFQRLLGHNPSSTEAAHLPVDRVTRTEAATFCKVLTAQDQAAGILPKGKIYRLPTTREWLLACLPGGLVPEGESLDAIAWHQGNSAGLLHPVGAKNANAYGLHDMFGNAAEWADPDEALAKSAAAKRAGSYLGRVVLQLSRPAEDPFLERTDGGGAADFQVHLHTQFEIIRSKRVLGEVARQLDLVSRWEMDSEDEVVERLKKATKVESVRGTDLVELRFYSDSSEEAAEVSDAIAKAYIGLLKRSDIERSVEALDQLELELQAQEDLLEESRTKLLELVKEGGLTDLSPNGAPWMRASGEEATGSIVMRSKLEESKLKEGIEELRQTIEALEGLEGDELIKEVIRLKLGDEALAKTYAELEAARLELADLRESGAEAADPKLVVAQQRHDALGKILAGSLEDLQGSMLAHLGEAEQLLAQGKSEREQNTLDEKRRSIEYLAAKDEYELHKALLAEMKQRVAITRVNEKMPKQRVTIHELATPMKLSGRRAPGSPVALGGSVADDREDLLEGASASAGGEERRDHVGFRFVMADE